MNEIKIKPKIPIKQLDKRIVQVQKLKNNLVTTKEKINEFTQNEYNDTAEDYASTKIENDIRTISRKGISKGNEIGKKSVKETKENFVKGKQKLKDIKYKINQNKEKKLKNIIDKSKKTIKVSKKTNIKTYKKASSLTKKSIKTTEQVAKNSEKVVKGSIKVSKQMVKATSKAIQVTIKGLKVAIKVTAQVVKSLLVAAKSLVSAIIAGGWVAIVIILVIALIGGFVAIIFNSNEDTYYDSSQIPNSDIVLVAKSQIGNVGGQPYWSWYGFKTRVEWCACFVSWCANECGYIDRGIIPKFAGCANAITWFKDRDLWHDRSESYMAMPGDIIFFDWKDENGKQDGLSDHVGIVARTDIINRNIYTIEGNTSDMCAERVYSFDDVQVMGYGSPKYE